MQDVPQTIPKRLPLLDAFLAAHPPKSKLLSDTTAVLIQHQLGSLVPLTRGLISLGLDPERIHCIDIPYTANPKVRDGLRRLGIPSRNFARSSYHLGKRYAAYQRQRIQELLSTLRKQ